jgi:cytoskeletal protein RodZ
MDVGAQLRTSREARGLSIAAVAHATRVQPRILAAIEQNDIAVVPPRPFGRGFVRAYARELGLDADAVTRDYFGQFAPPEPLPSAEEQQSQSGESFHWSASLPRWPAAAALGAVVLIVAFAVRGSSPPAPPGVAPSAPPGVAADAVGTSGTSAPAAASDDAAPAVPPRAAAAAVPAPAAPAANLTVVISATRRAWVSARSDGRRSLYQFVVPGSPQTLTGTRDITLRVGDAGALRWTINGRDAGPMGRSGEVRDLRVTPATAATVR